MKTLTTLFTALLLFIFYLTDARPQSTIQLDLRAIKDTLIAKTHSRDTLAARIPADSSFGVGYRVVYDSITVDTLLGKFNRPIVTVVDTAGGTADSTVFETWDMTLNRWVILGLINLKTGAYTTVANAGDDTITEYLINDPAIFYLRRRLVNSGANYKANRTSYQSLKLLNSY